jgi:hypothetical protein
MKKYQKIKKVRRLPRGKASLQRGLSFFSAQLFVVMGELVYFFNQNNLNTLLISTIQAPKLYPTTH